ncbi:MAG TPA: hypothetical protein VFR49_16525, partial [Solirubrobacteraceae bacterium]|nr:hypothetical protein [Solirubrobacteraceae bacterium]
SFGDPLVPYVQPQRTLADGAGYPIVSSSLVRAGVRYSVSMLATPVDGVAVDFVRVTMRNLTGTVRRARWAVGVRKSGGPRLTPQGAPYFRYLAPSGTPNGFYAQPGEVQPPVSRYAVTGGAIVRTAPGPAEAFVILAPGSDGPGARPPASCTKRTSVCAAAGYTRTLGPRRAAELVFKWPAVPVAAPGPTLTAIARIGYGAARLRVRRSFAALLGSGIRLRLPEAGVSDAFAASLVQILTSRYRLASGDWVQAVNDLQYHAFWLRDAAIMTNALDLAGLPGPAREDLDYFARWQDADGLFISRRGQYDGIGQALWALGRHAELTGDAGFARTELAAVGRAVGWIATRTAGDP